MDARHMNLKFGVAKSVLWFLFAVPLTAQSKPIMEPANREVSLQGTIRLVHGFGPPGYGEDPKHDAHVSYWAREVPVAINLPCEATNPEEARYICRSAKRLNLFFEKDGIKKLNDRQPAKWKDRQVLVRGRLHRADTAGEMTDIYMDVSEIRGITSTNETKP